MKRWGVGSFLGLWFTALSAGYFALNCSSGEETADAGPDTGPPIPDAFVPSVGRDTSIPETSAPVDAGRDTAVSDAGPDTAVPDAAACPSSMVRIPAGTYMMGSTTGELDEQPVHSETVSAFCMDVTEVTTAAYAACVRAGKCAGADTTSVDPRCNEGASGRGNHPINCVSAIDADAYCAFAGKRLPTEQEWEYAARGTTGNEYPWGNTPRPGAQICWNGTGNDLGQGNRTTTCPTGSYPAGNTPLGLQDMIGNVWEWTSSGYSTNYSQPRNNAARVYRGGGWFHDGPATARGADRGRDSPTVRFYDLGLRCAL